jgi:uncharacterized protein YbaP (TraB family)
MKKFTLFSLAATFILGWTNCDAQNKKSTKTNNGKTSVWKVSKGDHSIYLGGTVHILRKEDYPLPKAFENAYNDSKVLTFETDTKALGDPGLQQKVMSKGMYQDDRTLQTVLSKETYKELDAACGKYGLPIAMMQKMKPALVVTTISAMAMKKDMGMTEEGVDMYFTKKATEDKKELQQLETVDDQINRITMMGEGKEDEFVSYSLKDMKDMKTTLFDLITNWKSGEKEDMNKEIQDMKKDYPATYQSLLVERNNNWMPQIFSYLENGTKAFILVGTLHLHGPDGLLNKLKEQGYQISQM